MIEKSTSRKGLEGHEGLFDLKAMKAYLKAMTAMKAYLKAMKAMKARKALNYSKAIISIE